MSPVQEFVISELHTHAEVRLCHQSLRMYYVIFINTRIERETTCQHCGGKKCAHRHIAQKVQKNYISGTIRNHYSSHIFKQKMFMNNTRWGISNSTQ